MELAALRISLMKKSYFDGITGFTRCGNTFMISCSNPVKKLSGLTGLGEKAKKEGVATEPTLIFR